MTIVRVGSNDQYASNWDSIFGGKKSKTAGASASKKTSKKAVKKAPVSTKKKTAKKKK